ncbi:alpha/beta hydrolase fold [Nocardioides scoriae]|uniref:Alpha/beta hydrolase fold n=1 Tax=Nocardioides scoriae TaxID=642780 RepID=A0A1H1VKA9_9ACTN|nr:alpha/beta fold hydrolase [Nocardioides scoriae]SDS84706.1 alpha/beta hydrolase fold [Nocardioides scoriae]
MSGRVSTLAALLVTLLTATSLAATPQADARAAETRPAPGPHLAATATELDDALDCPQHEAGKAPVLLVHGTSTTPDISWSEGLRPLLSRDGYTVCTVRLPANAVGDINIASHFVVASIRAMVDRYHRPVNLVGHSQGGMLLRWVLKWWPDTRSLVGDVIGLAPSNHGAPLADALCVAACPAGIWQQRPGSQFLSALNAGDETPGRVDYSVFYSTTDTTVNAPSPVIRGDSDDTNIAVQSICPGRDVSHTQMQYDAIAVALVRDALTHVGPARPARISRVLCAQKYSAGIDEQEADRQQRRGAAYSAVAIAGAKQITSEPPLAAFAKGPAPRPHATIRVRSSRASNGAYRLALRAVGEAGREHWPLPFATFYVADRRAPVGPEGRASLRLPRLTRHDTITLRARGLAPVQRRLR